ncbi:MAG: DUF559 domain-containing protein [Ignavibacteriaceae bacterium]|nr:DUF559 domain-containing protein [Ignavibacteriaceae bacterium]
MKTEHIGDYQFVGILFAYEKKLIIELDGGHHNQDETKENDLRRQNWLESQNFKVIRFWNTDFEKY